MAGIAESSADNLLKQTLQTTWLAMERANDTHKVITAEVLP